MRSLPAALAIFAACAASPAWAQPLAAPVSNPLEIALSLEALEEVHGRQGIQTNVLADQQLTATSSGNSVTAGTLRSGDIAFSEGALNSFSGVGNFVVNTGNNNVLQGAISVTIVTTPGL